MQNGPADSKVLTDKDPMPFGQKHLGKKMEDVPVAYLNWMWSDVESTSRHAAPVLEYIERNMQGLKL